MTVTEAQRILADAELLADETTVTAAIARMATEITARLQERQPVVLCVMNGSIIFAGQLLPRLLFPLEVGYLHATRYGNKTRGGGMTWLAQPVIDLRGRDVLLLDDILDEGITLTAVADYCRLQGAASVLTAVLIDKRHDRKVVAGCRADFTGMEIADRFIFGYGLDYRGYWRNAPGIYAVKGL